MKNVFFLFFALLLTFIQPVLWADDTSNVFPVTIEVDFGPAGEKAILEHLEVRSGATPETALKLVAHVRNGFVCCRNDEVAAVNGIPVSPGANLWWFVTVNGSRNVGPYTTLLKPNDHVTWKYLHEKYEGEEKKDAP